MARIDQLLESLQQLQAQIEAEVQQLLAQKREQFRYSLRRGKVRFEREARKLHRARKIPLLAYLYRARLGHVLTAPVIYSVIVPIALMDLAVSLYQAVCFRVYGIPRVKRADYIVIDRHRLSYLNLIEKLNCVYCGYGNGVIEYAREITARTEQYWCPIKHARLAKSTHERSQAFVDYGDVDSYRRQLKRLREQLQQEA